LGSKGIALALLLSRADCLKFCEPQPPGRLWVCYRPVQRLLKSCSVRLRIKNFSGKSFRVESWKFSFL